MYLKIKRVLDVIMALILVIIFAVPMLIVVILIKLDDGGQVIYKQPRMGKGLKPFNMYKFRTMSSNRKEFDSLLTHDEMVTRVGKFLRATSIDELPQIINILNGDMSFVGPRPWIIDYYEVFTEEQKHRCDVLPGLSGLAQIKGRNGISVIKKIEYDLEYVRTASLKLDIKIFILSILAALRKSNAEISEMGIKKELTELKKINKLNKERILLKELK